MKKKICFFSFLLPFLSMMAIFIGNGIYPFGDQSFMHSDMYHQYVPFLEEFVRKVRDGEPLYYSWRIGMGSNYLSLYGYYSASPFNWLMLLLPEKYLIEFMSYMVVFKIGLCGFTFSWLLTEKFHTNDLSVLFFSTFYAMSGFVAAYNWNVMWMDTLVLAPLIVLGLEKLILEKKYSLYCIALGLCILSNYYLSIMVCMYIIRSSLSFAIPSPLQRAITIASFAAATSTYPILPAASAEFTIGFPLERLYTEIPASIAATLEVSSASGTLSKLLCRSSTAHFISSGPSFSAGPMFTSRYVAPASSCCFAECVFVSGKGCKW